MKKSRFSEEQKIGILRQVRGGRTVVAVCREHNIGVQTYYGWKRKYGAMEVNEARRLRALEEENGRLKRLVAEKRDGAASSLSTYLTNCCYRSWKTENRSVLTFDTSASTLLGEEVLGFCSSVWLRSRARCRSAT